MILTDAKVTQGQYHNLQPLQNISFIKTFSLKFLKKCHQSLGGTITSYAPVTKHEGNKTTT